MKFKVTAYLSGLFFVLVFVFGIVGHFTGTDFYFNIMWVSLGLGWLLYFVALYFVFETKQFVLIK